MSAFDRRSIDAIDRLIAHAEGIQIRATPTVSAWTPFLFWLNGKRTKGQKGQSQGATH